MPIFSRTADVLAQRRAVVVDGDTYYRSDWLDGGRDPMHSPTVFLVEQAPNVALRTHFHRNNQFQVFVQGGGRIGPHALRALTVHYAGAYTGYGPLQAGPEGVSYFTIRTVYETGSLTPQGDRDQMVRGPKRQLHSGPFDLLGARELAEVAAPKVDTLIVPEPDGVAAWLHTVAPGTRAALPAPVQGTAGAFWMVLGGALRCDGRRLGPWQSVYVGVADEPPALDATQDGAQVVALQMPGKDPAYAGRAVDPAP